MKSLINSPDTPDFLLKSTQWVSLVSIFILTPFSFNNFIQGRHLLGSFALLIAVLCNINAWFCYRGHYHLGLNLFGITPAIMLAIPFIMYELAVAGSFWAYLMVLAFYFILPEKHAWITNIIFMILVLPIALMTLDQPVVIRFYATLLGTSFFAYLSMREITKQHYLLKNLATIDNLTGLYNRSLLQSSLELAIHQSSRTQTAMTLLMIDLDHFKSINDDLGHNTGDSVLISVARYLKKSLRASDMLFRIGGEEFLALLHNTDEIDSKALAEKLRKGVAQLALTPDRTLTTSIGVSTLQPDMDWRAWMKISDDNMYRAKSGGRNQVVA